MAKKIQKAPAKAHGSAQDNADSVESRLLVYAEQLGWVVGTVQAKAEGWLDREKWTDQLTRIRDGAADLLTHFTPQPASSQQGRATVRSPASQSSGVDEPGARRRVRSGGVVGARGVKPSDQRMPKRMKAAEGRGRRGGRG
jgi:hypothetical protein